MVKYSNLLPYSRSIMKHQTRARKKPSRLFPKIKFRTHGSTPSPCTTTTEPSLPYVQHVSNTAPLHPTPLTENPFATLIDADKRGFSPVAGIHIRAGLCRRDMENESLHEIEMMILHGCRAFNFDFVFGVMDQALRGMDWDECIAGIGTSNVVRTSAIVLGLRTRGWKRGSTGWIRGSCLKRWSVEDHCRYCC